MKNNIIEKASKLFLQLGFKSVTMEDLAVSLGISKKTLYIHFENKNELVQEVAYFIFESVRQEILKIKENTSNPIEELHCIKMEVMKYLGNEIDVEFVSRLYLNGMRGIRDIEIFPIEQFKIEDLFENYLDYHLRAIITPKGMNTLTQFKSTT